jgi:hypothetical protein
VLLRVLALLILTMSIAIGSAAGGPRVSVPYQYAGVVENGRGAPSHYLESGDRLRFSFFDWLSKGRRSEPYQLCLGRAKGASLRCWNLSARYGMGTLALTKLPPNVPFSTLLSARWLVGGRTVATWPFYYVRAAG